MGVEEVCCCTVLEEEKNHTELSWIEKYENKFFLEL